jgi:hypothetical protein
MVRDGRIPSLWLVVPLIADLLTPYLIWKGVLPAPARWISHAAVATMIVIVCARMLAWDWIPGMALVILGISVIWTSVAVLRGQGIVPTAWGWWLMLQYPLVGLYAYLLPRWPAGFPKYLRNFCILILGLEVLVQIGQYLTGQQPGDNLAGTFGWQGHGPLTMFIMFTVCLGLGQWLAYGRWRSVVVVLGLGSIASAFAEIKFYPFALLSLGLLAAGILAVEHRQIVKAIGYMVVLAAVVWTFFSLYGSVMQTRTGTRSLESYLDWSTLGRYLDETHKIEGSGRYYLGRNQAFSLGFLAISGDPTTLLFGMGLGARGESQTLGSAGAALTQAEEGLFAGTSLLVMMQELGLGGLALLAGVVAWIVYTCLRDIRDRPQSEGLELRYALVLFSVLWVLWLWYTQAWTARVTMLLYWSAVGYVVGEARRERLVKEPAGVVGQHTVRWKEGGAA